MAQLWKDHFDEATGSTKPAPVIDAARDAINEHPQKRLVAHFQQPHGPFWIADGFGSELPESAIDRTDGTSYQPWEAFREGMRSREDVWRAYRETLEHVIDDVLELAHDLPGRTLIHADHGNIFGRRIWPAPLKLYDHPPNIRHPALNEVPWAIINGDRRKVVTNGIQDDANTDDELVEERLKALGYA